MENKALANATAAVKFALDMIESYQLEIHHETEIIGLLAPRSNRTKEDDATLSNMIKFRHQAQVRLEEHKVRLPELYKAQAEAKRETEAAATL